MRTRKKNLLLFASFVVLMAGCHKDYLDQGPLAIQTKDFLSSKKYSVLELQVTYVTGHRPTDGAINRLVDMMNQRLNKPDGITVAYKEVASPNRSSFTIADLNKEEKKERDIFSKGNKLTAFIFFADAQYSTGASILGVAYGTTSIAVFENEVEANSGGFAQVSRETLEATVIEHEFGHLFGLVDNGTSMVTPHADPNNPNHCNNSNCLMYYATESTDVLGNLSGGNVPDFDANCIADLRANGGK